MKADLRNLKKSDEYMIKDFNKDPYITSEQKSAADAVAGVSINGNTEIIDETSSVVSVEYNEDFVAKVKELSETASTSHIEEAPNGVIITKYSIIGADNTETTNVTTFEYPNGKSAIFEDGKNVSVYEKMVTIKNTNL